MDIYCPRCGEPFDPDEFHDVAAELGTTYTEISRRFFTLGCGIAFADLPCTQRPDPRGELTAELFALLGDDVDAVASELEDAEALGIFDGPCPAGGEHTWTTDSGPRPRWAHGTPSPHCDECHAPMPDEVSS